MPGPPPPEAIEGTIRWVERRFSDWYAAREPWLPPRFGRREFGFMWIGQKFFLRHTAMRSRADVQRLLVERAPAHAYYSLAYYTKPDAPTMKEKEWLGADLVFDLDADHLENADKMTFEEQLAAVKREAVKLLHEFVLGDLGFDAESVRVVFSGGRGYHIHVDDPRVHKLGSAERREIVDHVTGLGLDPARFRRETTTDRREFAGHVSRKKRVELPPADSAGWGGRITRVTHSALAQIAALPPEEAKDRLTDIQGVGPKRAEQFLAALGRRDASGHNLLDRLRDGDASPVLDALGERALADATVRAVNDSKGEADEPVTADVKRLIRLPGTLHGKTGLRVTVIETDQLAGFDPLRDAVGFGEEPVEVVVSKPERLEAWPETHDLAAGPQTLPLRAAMFHVLRRKALVPWE